MYSTSSVGAGRSKDDCIPLRAAIQRPSPFRLHPSEDPSMTRLLLPLLLLAPLALLPAADGKDDATVHLFNGKDLTHFYTFLGAPAKGEKPRGKNNDPDKVFSVHDGVLRISG